MTETFLILDTETGGLDARKHSLLSAAFRLVDGETLETIADLDFALQPLGGRYWVTPEAVLVNGIDVEAHREIAISRVDAVNRFQAFLGDCQPTVIGWNLAFDMRFLHAQFMPPEAWHSRVSQKSICLREVWTGGERFKRGKLTEVCRAHGIAVVDAHTAMGDVDLTHRLLKALAAEPRAAGMLGIGGKDPGKAVAL